MAMTLRLPTHLDQRLSDLTEQTGRTKSFYLVQALENYLEDMEDLLISNAVLERIKTGKERTYTAKEVRQILMSER
ncbi:CopG family transcriptional regulator [Pasteurellaceae bacterium LFhippo2]|nr:CopG family transcriptional regulator [Pasteurellaceae bacterium LFhippo2]